MQVTDKSTRQVFRANTRNGVQMTYLCAGSKADSARKSRSPTLAAPAAISFFSQIRVRARAESGHGNGHQPRPLAAVGRRRRLLPQQVARRAAPWDLFTRLTPLRAGVRAGCWPKCGTAQRPHPSPTAGRCWCALRRPKLRRSPPPKARARSHARLVALRRFPFSQTGSTEEKLN